MKENFIIPAPNQNTEDNPTKILSYIQKNPGNHLRGIGNRLRMSLGTLRYNLETLEKKGKIVSERYNLHKHYFIAGFFKEDERNVLKMLNNTTSRWILMLILERKNPTQQYIVQSLQISAPSVKWHITRLVDLGIILEFKEGRYRRYLLAISSVDIANLLKSYYSKEWYDWTNKLVNKFLSLST